MADVRELHALCAWARAARLETKIEVENFMIAGSRFSQKTKVDSNEIGTSLLKTSVGEILVKNFGRVKLEILWQICL
jgi:hypothetical protein